MKSTNHIPTYITRLFAVCSLMLLLTACSSGGDDGPPTGGNGEVEIVSFTPDSAFVGDEVEIAGLGFSPDEGENQVWFNDAEATIDSMDMSENNESGRIYTTVPEGATTGPIAVSVDGGERAQSGSDFTVRVPEQQEDGEEFATVYWSAEKANSNGGVQHAVIGISYTNDEGKSFSEILYDSEELSMLKEPNGIGAPYGIALDLNTNMVYWSSYSSSPEFIARASLDGTGTVDTLYRTDQGHPVNFVGYVALDLEAGHIYWASGEGIVRGSMEGHGDAPAEVIYPAGGDGFSGSGGLGVDLQLDTENSYVYWTEFDENEIGRGSLDGGTALQLLYQPSDANPALQFINEVFVDVEGGYVYVSDGEAPNGRILRGNLDGSGSLQTLYSGDEDHVSLASLALDQQRGYLYWSQTESGTNWAGTIMRGRADGSGQVEVVYDLREIQAEYGVLRVYGLTVAPDPGSAKAKRNGYLPPVYLTF